MAKKHREIGVAVVWRGDRILIDRRLPGGVFGGYWEFPGGKVEPGEAVVDCIRREIGEEIGIEIEVGDRLITIDHTYGDEISVKLMVHHCRYISGEPQAIECAQIEWVELNQLSNRDRYPMPEANYQIIAALDQNQ
ncbi:mutator MutT protein [Thalassoporum mexicanum PCC 7367]|uniref:8-oxo-dGTP diphosphatase MutT n=1 Tax=Thalassoporum mexicanum TaxID=3457544 RepID=UPI00029FB881|nr:8-oxo-dGTP diphosphatase MutT [Pseudanabaena sp. PCC 7367]AFY70053.1 mutator MutT protein [Pseudanabaena sp. PCC 7367]